jgi:5-methylcytosine-specific restriction protein B
VSEASAQDLIKNHAMWPDDFHDCIPRIAEVANLDLDIPADLTERIAKAAETLLVDAAFLDECAAALIAGNVVLQGPPGTGKSTLARALADAFNVELVSVTAHDDWSTFEVIGRQELRVDDHNNEEIVPINGHFTEAVIRCAGSIPSHTDNPTKRQATWLLVDELNRAHPDKAFGELFSVLGADEPVDITLGYQVKGNDVLVVPRRFRIIATVNSIDKQFVNALSQGLRRRFTFLTFDVPPRRGAGELWGSNDSLATREFSVVGTIAVQHGGQVAASNSSRVTLQVTR